MNQKRKRNCEMKQKEFQTDSIVIRVTISFVFLNSFLHQQVNTVHRWFKNHISNVPQIQYIQNHRLGGLWVIKLWQTTAYYLLYESFINFHSTFNYNIARSYSSCTVKYTFRIISILTSTAVRGKKFINSIFVKLTLQES